MCLRQNITLDFYGALSLSRLFLKIGIKKALLSDHFAALSKVQSLPLEAGISALTSVEGLMMNQGGASCADEKERNSIQFVGSLLSHSHTLP